MYVCIDGTSWECWLCRLVVVWQTFSLCTFTSCLVDILSQALLAKQQEEEGADVAFIQASMPYMKAGTVVCTVAHSIAALVSAMQRGRAPLAVDFVFFTFYFDARYLRSTAKGARGICIPPLLCEMSSLYFKLNMLSCNSTFFCCS